MQVLADEMRTVRDTDDKSVVEVAVILKIVIIGTKETGNAAGQGFERYHGRALAHGYIKINMRFSVFITDILPMNRLAGDVTWNIQFFNKFIYFIVRTVKMGERSRQKAHSSEHGIGRFTPAPCGTPYGAMGKGILKGRCGLLRDSINKIFQEECRNPLLPHDFAHALLHKGNPPEIFLTSKITDYFEAFPVNLLIGLKKGTVPDTVKRKIRGILFQRKDEMRIIKRKSLDDNGIPSQSG